MKRLPRTCYLICSAPRSGSHLLSTLLTDTLLAGHPQEHFNPWHMGDADDEFPDELVYDAGYVQGLFEKYTAPNGVFGTKAADDFAEKQKLAWEHVKSAIDQGLPCYGWELDVAEFYVVYGYDDGGEEATGYYFSGPLCNEGKGPKPWQELGDTGIGVIEMYSVKLGQAADDVKTVREALAFALEHAAGPAKWIVPDYKAGLRGYDNWIQSLEDGTADGFGTAYNAVVWSECRSYAVRFLQEAKQRLGGQATALFDQAMGQYRVVAESLVAVAEAFPFLGREPGHIKDETRIRAALGGLKTARDAEADGLGTLQRLVEAL